MYHYHHATTTPYLGQTVLKRSSIGVWASLEKERRKDTEFFLCFVVIYCIDSSNASSCSNHGP